MNTKWISVLIVLTVFMLGVQAADFAVTNVTYSPAPAVPGKPIDLFVTVKNKSVEDSREFVFRLNLNPGQKANTFPFTLTGDQNEQVSVDSIQKGRETVIKFSVFIDSTAPTESYALQFEFGEKGQVQRVSPYTISVIGRQPQIELLNAPILVAEPGQVVQAQLTVKNVGTSNAMDVLIGLKEERTVTTTGTVVEREVRSAGSSTQYISQLGVGEEQTVTLNLSVNPSAALETYTAPISLTFKDEDGTEYEVTRNIGLQINADAGLDVGIAGIDPLLYPGGIGKVSVNIFNAGRGPAKYTVVTVGSPAGTFKEDKIFIGTLESDDFDSFKSELETAASTPPGDYPLYVGLQYKDQYGNNKIVNKELKIKVYSKESAQAKNGTPENPLESIIIAVLVIVIVYVVYKKYVKKKQNEK